MSLTIAFVLCGVIGAVAGLILGVVDYLIRRWEEQ